MLRPNTHLILNVHFNSHRSGRFSAKFSSVAFLVTLQSTLSFAKHMVDKVEDILKSLHCEVKSFNLAWLVNEIIVS